MVQHLQKCGKQQRNKRIVLVYGIDRPDDDEKHGNDTSENSRAYSSMPSQSAVAANQSLVWCGRELHGAAVSTPNQLP